MHDVESVFRLVLSLGLIARCGICIYTCTGVVIYDLVNDVESVFRLMLSFMT